MSAPAATRPRSWRHCGQPAARWVPAQRIRHFARAAGEMATTDVVACWSNTPPGCVPARPRRRMKTCAFSGPRSRADGCLSPPVPPKGSAAGRSRWRASRPPSRLAEVLDTEIAALEADIRAAVRACRETAARAARIETLPGIGPVTSAVPIADLPELGRLRSGQIAALGGLAPHTRQSGAWRGRSFISGGRKPVRGALYMAATSTALRGSSRFARHDKSLRARGKPHKLALVAVMRKMLVTLNAMLRANVEFQT